MIVFKRNGSHFDKTVLNIQNLTNYYYYAYSSTYTVNYLIVPN